MSAKINYCSSKQQTVSKEQLKEDFRKIGLQEGDDLVVTLSLKRIGYLKGGPDEFIDGLLEVIGPNGSLMMNTFNYSFPLSCIPLDYIFDHKSTKASTGLVPETFRKRKGVLRSRHPTCSVAVFGKYKNYLTKGHDETSDSYLPYTRLAKIDGKYLCIGIGHRLVAIRHESQHRAGLSNILPLYCGVRYKTEQGRVKLFVSNVPACTKKLPELVPDLIKTGIMKKGKIGMTQAYVAPARQLIDSMTKTLKKKPELNLCDDIFCLWCRELERRLNLYNKIVNPKIFQKNKLLIKIIALFNRVRSRRYNLLLFLKGNGDSEINKIKSLRLQKVKQFLTDVSLAFRALFHSKK